MIGSQSDQDWSIDSPSRLNSSQASGPRSFPSIEGNSRGPGLRDEPEHSTACRLVDRHWIGSLLASPMLGILPKSRPLIGREPRMLASHWSRAAPGNFPRQIPTFLDLCQSSDFRPQLTVHRHWMLSKFISGVRSSVVSLYRGKQPRTEPSR